jgi:betaine reductase
MRRRKKMSKIKVVHYLNQFFGQIGGEEKADVPPELREGAVGPGLALNAAMGDEGEIVATVICGDSYFNENIDQVSADVLAMIREYRPDVVIAGPAFNAGRYGVACGAVAKVVSEELNIPVVTGMYPENPGVDLYKKYTYIVETGNSAAGMRKAVAPMAKLALKLGKGEVVGGPAEEGYIPRGIRVNLFAQERGAKRAVEMLVQKLQGASFETEYPMPVFDRVAPGAPIKDLTQATIALVTTGGIVPKGNPDRIESSSASKYGKYSLAGIDDLNRDNSETAHGGYDPVCANIDGDRVLPVDVLKEIEAQGKIGKLHEYWYSTVGNGTSVANSKEFAAAIAQDLQEAGVDGVILTST